ncbi:MAG: twin-arginine translocase TatA/TatE family subunit [Sulfurimonas sp.]|jgi:sec-independent protein translocase protein TatA
MAIPSGMELVVILGVVVLLFGSKKIPELAKGIGQGIKNFKKEMQEEPVETAHSDAPKNVEAGIVEIAHSDTSKKIEAHEEVAFATHVRTTTQT